MSGDALTATLFIFVPFEYFVVPHESSALVVGQLEIAEF